MSMFIPQWWWLVVALFLFCVHRIIRPMRALPAPDPDDAGMIKDLKSTPTSIRYVTRIMFWTIIFLLGYLVYLTSRY